MFAAYYNIVEVGLWTALGTGMLTAALFCRGAARWQCVAAAIAFLLFAASDAVELRTGAWWRPWWLLAWKAACIAALAGLYVRHRLTRRLRRAPVG